MNWTKSVGAFLSEWFSFRSQVQKHFFSSCVVLSRYWLFLSCSASLAVCAAAQGNGSGKWSARKIQSLLPQILPACFTTGWFVSLITVWCNEQLYWHHCDGNKWTKEECGRRATPTLLAWLLNVEWQLKLLFQILLEFCSEEQLLRVWFVSLFHF